MANNLQRKRNEVVDGVAAILDELENHEAGGISVIRGNLFKAREYWENDGEYNYNVRFSLLQIRRRMERHEVPNSSRLMERVEEIEENLEENAELPPPSEVTR